MGHGREAFFWSLIASVGVFVGGGVVSIYYGITSLGRTGGHEAYLLGYLVLGIIVVADAWTLHAALKPLRRSPAVAHLGFWAGLRQTSDAGARTLIFDNAAAVVGGLIGIIGLAVHQITGNARADAVASLVIGFLLLATTVLLLQANRELLTDRSLVPEVLEAMRTRIDGTAGVARVLDLVAVFTGPQAVLVTGTVVLEPHLEVAEVEQALADAGAALASPWPGELRVYLVPVPGDS
jgi:divalent metal cation (Fe/Co/Zn/Cd) transporter